LNNPVEKENISSDLRSQHLSTTPLSPVDNIVDMQGTILRSTSNDESIQQQRQEGVSPQVAHEKSEETKECVEDVHQGESPPETSLTPSETVNQSTEALVQEENIPLLAPSESETVNEPERQEVEDNLSSDVSQLVTSSTPLLEQVSQDEKSADAEVATEPSKLVEDTSNIEDSQVAAQCIINVDCDYDGDASSVLSSKTCSVEDVSLSGVQDDTSSKQNEEDEKQEYVNPRGVRFMSQEVGQNGELGWQKKCYMHCAYEGDSKGKMMGDFMDRLYFTRKILIHTSFSVLSTAPEVNHMKILCIYTI
jgi:hypothetical protein